MGKKLTQEEFIEKAKLKHGDKYDYSMVEYKNVRTNVIIVCRKHGEFSQKPNKHISGQGCMMCRSEKNTLTTNVFIEKAILMHKDRYDYSLVDYKYTKNKVIIICKEHGEFKQTPMTHLRGTGCPICAGRVKQNTDDFIKRAKLKHGNRYSYTLVNYVNIHKKIIIVCKEHGEFKQTPNSHLYKSGCPKCSYKFGKIENEWLDMFNIDKEYRQYKILNYKVDGYDPKSNTIYEFNGDYWHGNPNKYNPENINSNNGKKFGELYEKTLEKEIKLKELGYNFISIWESDFIIGKY